MKLLRNIVIGFVIIVVVLIAARDIIIRFSMEEGIRVATGLKLTIDEFNIGLVQPTISIKGLKLYNPAGYPEPLMVDIPEVYCEYKPTEILKGQIALKQLRLTIQELTVIKQGGQSNIDALKALQPKGGGPPPQFSVDDFTLNISKVYFKQPPLSKEFDLNLSEHYTNISGVDDLVRLVVVSALSKTSIANLVNLNGIKQGLPSILLNSLNSNNNPLKGLLNSFKLQQ